jgi:hypothetical protein
VTAPIRAIADGLDRFAVVDASNDLLVVPTGGEPQRVATPSSPTGVIVLPADPRLVLPSFRPYATSPRPASRVGYDSAVGRNNVLLTGN